LSDKKGDNTLYENGIGWFLMLVIFAVLAYIFWYYHATEVRSVIRWIRYSEMWVMSWVASLFAADQFTVMFENRPTDWWAGFKAAPRFHPEELTYEHLAYFGALSMQPLRPIFYAMAAMAGFWCLLYGPGTQYRQRLNLEGLIRRQAKNFPIISPFVNFDPGKQPARPPGAPVPAELPLFAEALGPEEWLAYNHIPAPDGKIDEQAAAEAFEKQLGTRWKGAMALEPYQQILLAAFCMKASRKRAEADDILSRLALCWDKSGLKLRRDPKLLWNARRILKNSKLSGKTIAQANRHAYVTTAMMRALFFARNEGGVLAPAQFVWLRAHDRNLWYPLNNLGRQSYHMEALGAMGHFKAERMTQRPIPVAKVLDAVSMLKEYMLSNRARPIPALDYKGTKKKGIKMAR
jgi:intracellular multiplication protein IcmP